MNNSLTKADTILFSSVICRLKFLKISGDAWKPLENKGLKKQTMWDKSSASERPLQLEHLPADACTISKISHKQHTYLGKRMLQSTRIKTLKNRWLFVNSTSVVQNLD